MKEIRFHGRGGQGAVIACRILGLAAFKEGLDAQSFPFFGVERRGAPVTAFTRIDTKKIRIKTLVYKPDYIIVLDPTLIKTIDVASGMKRNGLIVINSPRNPSQLRLGPAKKVFTVDAEGIALKYGLGSPTAPIVNTTILGAFARISGEVKISSIVDSIKEYVPVKVGENISAAEEAYKTVSSEEK